MTTTGNGNFVVFTGTRKAFDRVRFQMGRDSVVRKVRGHKMHTWGEVFDEFSAAYQFPYYFGENISALEDCMTDLEWLKPVPLDATQFSSLVLMISDVSSLLSDEGASELHIFVKVLKAVVRDWWRPEGVNSPHDGVRFTIILHANNAVEAGECMEKWRIAGIDLEPFQPIWPNSSLT